MTNRQRIYNLIAAMGGMRACEIVAASGWPGKRVYGILEKLTAVGAIFACKRVYVCA